MNRSSLGFGFVMAAALASAAVPAQASSGAVEAAATALAPNDYVWSDTGSSEPVNIIVSIPDQRAYVYRGAVLVAASSVSTGKDGKATPTGSYTILQKKEDHKSNLYNAAPMPFMQRLTWDGIAIHAGRNPGFPASHGCIRVPTAFAKKLYAITQLGTTVTVTDESVGDSRTMPQNLVPQQGYTAQPDTSTETINANADQLAVYAQR